MFQLYRELDSVYNAVAKVANEKSTFCSAYLTSVPARLGKWQGAKEIGHNLAREQPKFGHNLVRKRHKIGHSLACD